MSTDLERTKERRQGEGLRRQRGVKTNLVHNALEQPPGLIQATQEEQAVLWPCTRSGSVSSREDGKAM